MEYLGIFGLMAFFFYFTLSGKVTRLERIIRANGIENPEAESMGEVLEKYLGKTVVLSLHGSLNLSSNRCLIEDTDGKWLLVKVNPNKKNETEKLIRIDLIKSLSLKQG